MPSDKHTLARLCSHKLLSLEEECELGRKARSENPDEALEAIHALVIHNTRLVLKMARGLEQYGADVDDLVSEGVIGLHRAAEKFDPNVNVRFGTYALWWIRQQMWGYINDHGRAVRLPAHWNAYIRKLKRISEQLQSQGIKPSPETLSEHTGIPVESIRKIQSKEFGVISLDSPTGENGENTLLDSLADPNSGNPAQSALNESDFSTVLELIETLKPREKEIVIRRFGLNGQKAETLEEVANEWGISRERIRQIQATALEKLKTRLQEKESTGWILQVFQSQPKNPSKQKKI